MSLTPRKRSKRSRIATDQKELQLRESEGRIEDVKNKLNSCSTNREYQTLVEQIAADEQANSVLSDEILELFDKTTQLESAAETAEEERQKIEAEMTALRQRVDETRENLETDIARLTDDLTAAEAQLPSEFVTEYQRLVKARGEEGLAPLEGEICGGCFQTITTQMLNEVLMNKPCSVRHAVACSICPNKTSRGEIDNTQPTGSHAAFDMAAWLIRLSMEIRGEGFLQCPK